MDLFHWLQIHTAVSAYTLTSTKDFQLIRFHYTWRRSDHLFIQGDLSSLSFGGWEPGGWKRHQVLQYSHGGGIMVGTEGGRSRSAAHHFLTNRVVAHSGAAGLWCQERAGVFFCLHNPSGSLRPLPRLLFHSLMRVCRFSVWRRIISPLLRGVCHASPAERKVDNIEHA